MLLIGEESNLSGAILLRAMPTLTSPSTNQQANIPILFLSGTNDELVTEDQAKDLAEQLNKAGAKVQHIFIDSGHGILEADVLETRSWLANHFSL